MRHVRFARLALLLLVGLGLLGRRPVPPARAATVPSTACQVALLGPARTYGNTFATVTLTCTEVFYLLYAEVTLTAPSGERHLRGMWCQQTDRCLSTFVFAWTARGTWVASGRGGARTLEQADYTTWGPLTRRRTW